MMTGRRGVAFAVALSLAGCQTTQTAQLPILPPSGGIEPAQGESFCERNVFLCILGGVILVGGVVFFVGHAMAFGELAD